MRIGYCYKINYILNGIHQFKSCYPCIVMRGLWVRSPSGTGKKFLPFFSSHFSFIAFFTLTALRVYPGVCASLWAGKTCTINIPVFLYLAYGSTVNFQFRGPNASIDISKESQGYGDHYGNPTSDSNVIEIFKVNANGL